MHNDEGKLFEAVFHKLLALGIAVVALAAVVWIIWAIVRTSAITNEGSQSREPRADGSSMQQAPRYEALLASVRATAPRQSSQPAKVGSADAMVALTLRPVAALVSRVNSRLPSLVGKVAADAAFFVGGPS